MSELLYVEVMGTNCFVGGQHGTVRGLLRDTPTRITHVFVRLDHPETGAQDGGDMLLVKVNPTPIGERGWHRSVMSWQPISLEQFDQLNGLNDLRRDLGWLWMTAPWPDVWECHYPAPALVAAGHVCPQCDGSHDHEWAAGPETPSGVPVRCKTCGGRKCDMSTCLLRRHHGGPHEHY